MVPAAPSSHFSLRLISAHSAHLPPAPRVLGRLLAAIGDGNSSLQFIAELVRVEPVLGGQLLRVANSALFGFRVPAASVEEAVLRIGMREVQRIVGLAATARLFLADLAVYGTTADALWENAVLTAMAMEGLAERTGNDPAMAYTAGLLRSVGKMVLARHAAGLPAVRPLAPGGETLPEWERSLFGTTHAEVGATLCDTWRLPRAIGLAIRDHLQPAGGSAATTLAHLLNAAGAVTTELGRGLPGEAGLWTVGPERRTRIGLADEDLLDVAGRAMLNFEKMNETLALVRG